MDYQRVVDEIMGSRRFGHEPGSAISRRMLSQVGFPERSFSIIHIAGTNGKGSVASYVAAVLSHAGYRTGLFTSPHIVDFCERIRVDGEMISRDDVVRLYEVIKGLGGSPTMFDISFLMSMLYFKECGCDYAVIETGLGGRLDSTNGISKVPEVSVITGIGLDHTEVLGSDIEHIAMEKAGIIKPGTTVVLGVMPEAASHVIIKKCRDIGVFNIREVVTTSRSYPEINRATADAVIDELEISIQRENRESIYRIVDEKYIMGRLQKIGSDPFFYVDGAHNPPAARALLTTLTEKHPGRKFCFLVGGLKNHDTRGVIEKLLPGAAEFLAVRVDDPNAYSAEEIRDMVDGFGATCSVCEDLKKAMDAVRRKASKTDTIAVACGSLYLVGEILHEIQITS